MLLHMIVIFIDIIKRLINPKIVGAPQSHQAHE